MDLSQKNDHLADPKWSKDLSSQFLPAWINEENIPSDSKKFSLSFQGLQKQIDNLQKIVIDQSMIICELRAQGANNESKTMHAKLIPSPPPVPTFVDATPIPTPELCSEMSKCFERARCGEDAAIFRLSQLAATYPLAAAFRFYGIFLRFEVICPTLERNYCIDSDYLRFVCDLASSEDSEVKKRYAHMLKYAQFLLGHCFKHGHGKVVAQSMYQCKKLMALSAEASYPPALSILGFISDSEGNHCLAAEFYLKAANMGYFIAQGRIAYYYWYGLGGMKRDREEALRWYQAAADQGYAPAKSSLSCYVTWSDIFAWSVMVVVYVGAMMLAIYLVMQKKSKFS